MSSDYKPLFVDLFYAVVVGSAITLILPTQSWSEILVKVFLMIVVLEDWYAYYRHVLPIYVKKQFDVNFSSLLIEFAILLSWYFAFTSLPCQLDLFLISYGLFFFIKLFAGFIIYFERGKIFSKKTMTDCLFLLSILSVVLLYSHRGIMLASKNDVFVGLALVWLSQTVLWWTINKSQS